MASNSKKRIHRRVVNSKRHTVGYILTGGQEVTVAQAVKMARSGKLSGVRVFGDSSRNSAYLQSTTTRRLSDLPETMLADATA